MTPDDPWAFLQNQTTARIAQGRTGHSLPTRALLDFQLDHARARDAVHARLDTATLLAQFQALYANPLLLHSQATDRQTYLQRPDLGRKLNDESGQLLAQWPNQVADVAIVVADGLSATAIANHAVPVVSLLVEAIKKLGWSLAPLCVVGQGRVAIGDEIAYALRAELVVVLIGERPGLSSPDSMGAYLTYRPRPGLTDESRNCVSNIRSGVDSPRVDSPRVDLPGESTPEGLTYEFAVQKMLYLLTEMKTRKLSGVGLKDEMPIHTQPNISSPAATVQIPETPD